MEVNSLDIRDLLYRFMVNDLEGFLVTDSNGDIVYRDEKSANIDLERSNWRVACPPAREGQKADLLFKAWEEGLAELNRRDDGICCVMACGMVYGEKGYNLDALLEEADRLMYEDKKRKKALSGQ